MRLIRFIPGFLAAMIIAAMAGFLPVGVQAQVSVSSFSPGYGSPGDIVHIDGTGFYPGTLVVRFNGVRDATAEATTTTHIQAMVPAGATTGPISVSVNGSTPASSLNDFVVVGSGPYITGINPGSGSVGTRVTVSGVHFTGVTSVYFGSRVGLNLNKQSDISIQIDAPTGVETSYISVRSPLGTNSSPVRFFVPPAVTSAAPFYGRTGTNVLVRGINFLGTTAVTIGGVNAAFNVHSNAGMTITVPTNAVTGTLRVFAPAGSFTTTSNFVVRPTIYGFSPASGPVGSIVVVTGANFNVGTPVIRFGGIAATVSEVAFGSLKAIVPATATTGLISVHTTDGTDTNSTPFYVTATITSFTPTNSAPGTRVKITGKNFTGATEVLFGGVPAASFTVTNATTIGATVPEGVVTGPITVITPAGSASSATLFYGAPNIVSFTPTHGLPGTNVTIYGTNLLGATAVRFNGVNATSFIATNNGFIRATVPSGALAGPISVVAPAGTNFSTDSFVLDYADLAVSMTLNVPYVFAGSNFAYNIIVLNRGPVDAPNVVLTNRWPAGATLVSASLSGSITTNQPTFVAQLGNISVGSYKSVTLVGRASSGTLVNQAGAYSGFPDLVSSNNTAQVSSTVLPAPVLNIVPSFTNEVISISWPVALSNFTLQYSGELSSTSTWSTVLKGKTTNNGIITVTDTNRLGNRFYRLFAP